MILCLYMVNSLAIIVAITILTSECVLNLHCALVYRPFSLCRPCHGRRTFPKCDMGSRWHHLSTLLFVRARVLSCGPNVRWRPGPLWKVSYICRRYEARVWSRGSPRVEWHSRNIGSDRQNIRWNPHTTGRSRHSPWCSYPKTKC